MPGVGSASAKASAPTRRTGSVTPPVCAQQRAARLHARDLDPNPLLLLPLLTRQPVAVLPRGLATPFGDLTPIGFVAQPASDPVRCGVVVERRGGGPLRSELGEGQVKHRRAHLGADAPPLMHPPQPRAGVHLAAHRERRRLHLLDADTVPASTTANGSV